jgi:MazG family protein
MSATLAEEFLAYVGVVKRLRKECPWDREQTHDSLKNHLLEEAYEAAEAIEQGDLELLRDELGDLLLHITLHSVIAEESGTFALLDLLVRNREKLVRRHPHVFADKTFSSKEEVKKNWELSKLREGRASVTHGLPLAMPALTRAWRLQDKVSKVGFDWNESAEVWKKVEEEKNELAEAVESGDRSAIENELGDLLFAVVNYSRFLDTHPEDALRRATLRFQSRFRFIEQRLSDRGLRPEDVSLREMDELWEESKKSGGA